jgi:hypothetical protein
VCRQKVNEGRKMKKGNNSYDKGVMNEVGGAFQNAMMDIQMSKWYA